MNKTNSKKILIMLLSVIAFVCIFLTTTGFINVNAESASDNISFSAEKYTDNDALLLPNGLDSDKDIKDFAYEVKAAAIGTSFPEIVQVVPAEYLESQETNAVFKYNGKEYGFYMVKNGSYFDLLLIDFVFTFDDGKEHDNEHKIRVEPILQERFERIGTAGNYQWIKSYSIETYYILNPRFLAVLQNENSLNYGDAGYVKEADSGSAIDQIRVNYSKVSLQYEDDFSDRAFSVIGKKVISYGVDIAIDVLEKVYNKSIFGLIKDMIEIGNDIFAPEEISTIIANNEDNIFTAPDYGVQRKDPTLLSYSRSAAYSPDDEIILSADHDSYAEFIISIDENDAGSCIERLDTMCEFDIVSRSGSFASTEHVAGNWEDENAESLNFSHREILFDNEPQFNITNGNIEGATIPVYVLPEGQQKIAFEAGYSAYYCFESDPDVGIEVFENADKVTDEQGDYYLQAGKTYLIVLSSNSNEKIISDLAVGIAERVPDKPASANEKLILKISVQQADAYNLSTGSPNVLIENIFTAGAGGLAPYDMFKGYIAADEISLPMQDGDYFVVIRFTESSGDGDYEIGMTACEEKSLGQTVTINADGINYRYVKFEGVAEGKYVVASDCDDEITYRIYDGYLEDVTFSGANNCGSFNIDGNTIFVGILADSDASFVLNPVGVAYEWRVSGNKVNINANSELEIGKTYKIELFVNGIKQDGRYIQSDNNEYCKISYENNDAWLKISGMSDLGLAFTLDYQVGEVRPFDCDLELLTKYTLTFKGIKDIVNGETIELEWVHSEDLTEIEYSIEKADRNGKISVKNYTIIPVSGAATGATYSKDITKDVEEMNDYLSDATIRINKIGVQMPEGVRYFEMPELDANFYKKVNCFFGGGSGAEDDPFTISCIRHFSNIELNNNNETHFELTTGIRLSGKPIEDFYGVLTTSNAPYGSMNVIYSLSKAAGDSLDGYGGYGIFVNNYGTISNIQARVDFTVTGKNNTRSFYSGGIVAYNYGTINNCSVVSSNISTQFFNGAIGGIAGRNSGTIEDCWASIEITSYSNMGGIAGENIGTIKDCSIMGNLNHTVYVYNGTIMSACIGGIVGDNQKGGIVTGCVLGSEDDATLYIKNCNEIDLNLWKGPYMGPVYGRNNGKITDCMSYHYELDKGGLVMFSQIVNINYDIP